MGRTMRHFSSIASIKEIDLYKVGIKVYLICPKLHFIYLVNPHLVFYLSKRYFNGPRNILYIEKLAVGQLITSNRSMIT